MKHLKYLSSLGIGLVAFTAISQTSKPKLPVVEVLGKQYYVYEAKKNQTFFNIANDFNWNLEELIRINSNVLSPMSKGTKIYYPCDPETVDNGLTLSSTNIDLDRIVEPLTHLVKKGETVYGISLKYHIPIERLYEMNPESRNGIKAGEILKVSDTSLAAPAAEENPDFYTIKKGDTLYQLARTYNTTVAAILKLNPGISENNFRTGEEIKLPEYGEGIRVETKMVEEPTVVGFSTYQVDKKDTWDSISEKTGVSVDDLKKANGGKSGLKNKQILGIPQIGVDSVSRTVITEDPREQTISGVVEIYEDVHGVTPSNERMKEVKIGIVMEEPSSKKDLEFTRGFLTGVNKVKNRDYRIDVKVFDGRWAQDRLIDSLGNYGASLIFTTYEKNTPAFFADYAIVSQVPIINTFDLKDERYLSNPYFVNILTPSNYFNEEIVNNLAQRYPYSTLLIVGGDKDDTFSNELEDKWGGSKTVHLSSADALKEYPIEAGATYLILGNVSKKSEISELVEEVIDLRNEHFEATFGFVGRPSWIVYDDSMKEDFHKADILIPARFYYDKSSKEADKFEAEYRNIFNMTPAKSFPMYSTMGYDEAIYFIPSWVEVGGDINDLKESRNSVQSDFSFIRPENWSGLYNPLVYLVRFSPLGTIEKLKVK